MDIPVTKKETEGGDMRLGGPERMIWVDTTHSSNEAIAVCVTKFGKIKTFRVDDLYVCEDSKPRILLDPARLQAVLKQRMGSNKVVMPGPGGMQMKDVTVEKISADKLKPGLFNFPGAQTGRTPSDKPSLSNEPAEEPDDG